MIDYSPLLNLMWRAEWFSGREFACAAGERVAVVSSGEASDDAPGIWQAAVVTVDGERRHGSVAVGDDVPVPAEVVLRVVCDVRTRPVLGAGDRLVPQICVTPPSAVAKRYGELMAGAASRACAPEVAALDPLRRTSLYTSLLVGRLQRKTARISAIFAESEYDWHQTFHTLLMQAMGGDRNREAFTALAAKATSAMVSREKGSLLRVEALLLGTAGFLFHGEGIADRDDYTLRLEEEARHLFAKYSITPLRPAVWNLSGLYPANHPATRLASISALLGKSDFMLDGVLRCRTSEDVERLFAATASEYWRTHYTPSGKVVAPSAKTIGRAKARLVGINLAAPLMFAYGRETGDEELCERSLDLLATIPPETNHKLAPWYDGGCTAESGFDSQALLELGEGYCARGACADCRVGRPEIKKALSDSFPQ